MNEAYELAACGLLTANLKGQIQQANRTLCRWLGYTSEALCERKFQDLLTVGSKLFHHTQWMPLLQMQRSLAEVQLEMVTAEGKVLPVLVNAASRSSDPGALIDIAVLVASDRRSYERQLLEARRRAEQLLASELRAQAAKASAIRRLESFVLGAPTAIAVMTGPDLTFEIVNDRFQALLHGASVVDRPAREAMGLAENSKLWALISTTYTTGKTVALSDYASELSPRRRSSLDTVHLDVVAQATLDSDGKRNGVILYIVDVTERVVDRLRLEEKNRELDSFAYVASHDLKTPLRGLANLVTWVKEDDGERLSAQSHANLDLMLDRIRRMNALIDGVLRFARSGAAKEVEVELPVREVVQQIVEMLVPAPGIRIELVEPMPTIRSSRVAFEQVVLNLISNALRFVPPEDGLVRIAATERDQRLVVSVADSGPGIAPEHHERIWRLFQTLAPAEHGGGTGLGLAIVRKVVEARGGSVWVESQPGAGATFFFTWPLGAPPDGDG